MHGTVFANGVDGILSKQYS